MRTILLAVGKLRPCFRQACDEYLNRIRRYGAIEEREIREAGRSATPALRRREESARLAQAIPAGAHPVVLDPGGQPWSSEQLARELDRWRTTRPVVALVIGGAFGLEPDALGSALTRWSLGPLTLPHELARVLVLEQWYRAWTILRGEGYHK
jgi:23S rRNA (pseudouridine1915-N3)-methyltransferase